MPQRLNLLIKHEKKVNMNKYIAQKTRDSNLQPLQHKTSAWALSYENEL